jgi:Tfp pilus assembly protein FimT
MIRTHDRRSGFSLLELMIVVAITMAVAAIAIPRAITATQNFKLRSTASSLSGLIQKARMFAVARNGFYPVLTGGSGSNSYAFIDTNGSGTLNTSAENTNVLMPANVTFTSAGHPADATILNGLTAVYSLPKFNPRGLPCFDSPCVADPGRMYIMFLCQDRTLSATAWAAVNVTPAGRVQVWTWDGGAWE